MVTNLKLILVAGGRCRLPKNMVWHERKEKKRRVGLLKKKLPVSN